MRILVVDDDLIFGKNFAAILREKGYTVEVAKSGKSAFNALKATTFEIVFLDVRLPDMDGVEVLKKIKAISPKTNVIMITAYSFDNVELIREGAFGYFCKPFDINLVFRAIEELTG